MSCWWLDEKNRQLGVHLGTQAPLAAQKRVWVLRGRSMCCIDWYRLSHSVACGYVEDGLCADDRDVAEIDEHMIQTQHT